MLVAAAGAARSLVLKESDVVIMVGARLNWLLSHGKGRQWGEPHSTKFVQIDIEPREMDSNVEIAAPVVGDIESSLAAMSQAMGDDWAGPPAEWADMVREKRETNVAKMAPTLQNNASPIQPRSLRTLFSKRSASTKRTIRAISQVWKKMLSVQRALKLNR